MAENSTLAEHLNSTDDDEDSHQKHPHTEYQLTSLDSVKAPAPTGGSTTKPNKGNLISSYLSSSSSQSNAGTGAKSDKVPSSPPSS